MYCMFRIAAHWFGAAIASFCAYRPRACRRREVHTKESHCACRPPKYRSITDGQQWKNPHLIVQAKGIDPWPISRATKNPTMAPADAVAYSLVLNWPASVTIVQQAPQKSYEAILAGY
jgi:hypothetical protein